MGKLPFKVYSSHVQLLKVSFVGSISQGEEGEEGEEGEGGERGEGEERGQERLWRKV